MHSVCACKFLIAPNQKYLKRSLPCQPRLIHFPPLNRRRFSIWKFNSHRLPFNSQCSPFYISERTRQYTGKWNKKLNQLNLKVKLNFITNYCWIWRKMLFSIVKHEIACLVHHFIFFHLFSNELLLWCDAGCFWSVGTQSKSFEHVTWKPK